MGLVVGTLTLLLGWTLSEYSEIRQRRDTERWGILRGSLPGDIAQARLCLRESLEDGEQGVGPFSLLFLKE